MTVLGISPGTRSLGIALIKNRELLDWRIKDFPGPWSENKLGLIKACISEILVREGVQKVGIKITAKVRSSEMLICLENEILTIIETKQICVRIHTIQDLKNSCKSVTNKCDLARHLTEVYPFLRTECDKQKLNGKTYYNKLFEAIASAHIIL